MRRELRNGRDSPTRIGKDAAVNASQHWDIGSIRLTRVSYFDTPLPPEAVALAGLALDEDWMQPWVIDAMPAVGQAFWVIESAGTTIVADPCGASDEFLRAGADAVTHQEAAFAAFAAAGFDRLMVDLVVLTHLDGIGMAAWSDGAGGWSPAFPNARLVVSEPEYDAIVEYEDTDGRSAFLELDQQGHVDRVAVDASLAEGVSYQHTAGHTVGHCAISLASGDAALTLLGHLAVSPLHVALAGQDTLHVEPERSWAELSALLDASANGLLLAGSLWPGPGVARYDGGHMVAVAAQQS